MSPMYPYDEPTKENIKDWLKRSRMQNINIFDDHNKIIADLCVYCLKLLKNEEKNGKSTISKKYESRSG